MPLAPSYLKRKVLLVAMVYAHDVKFRRHEMEMRLVPGSVRSRRDKIQGYSKKSKKRFRELLRNTQHYWTHEIQLSYGRDFPHDGKIVKYHRKLLIEALQREYPDIKWVWRRGFQQERGRKGMGYAPHLHFMTDRFVGKDWLAEVWARIVGSSDLNHKKVSTHVDKIRNVSKFCNYMVNYMAKDDETKVPEGFDDVGRFWGIKRGIVEKEEFRKVLPANVAGRSVRLFRRWYRAELRSWGIYKWRPLHIRDSWR